MGRAGVECWRIWRDSTTSRFLRAGTDRKCNHSALVIANSLNPVASAKLGSV